MTLLEAALGYVEKGLSVVPLHSVADGRCTCGRSDCDSEGKHPRTSHGLKDASSDVQQIRTWWARWPDANIGLLTGVQFWALDVDGEAGRNALAKLESEHGALPETAHQKTGGGGEHLLFKMNGAAIGNRTRVMPGLDIRGHGGYLVAAPSIHLSGDRYSWEVAPGEIELAEAPDWLVDLATKRPKDAPIKRPPLKLVTGRTPYGQKALEDEIAKVRTAGEGTRNDTVNRASFALGQLVGGGEIDRSAVESELLAAALACGLGEHEARQTIQSGIEAGMTDSRTAPEKPKPITGATTRAGETHRTDLGNAQRFTDSYGNLIRFTVGAGWLVNVGPQWERDTTGRVHRLAMESVKAMYAEAVNLSDAERKEQVAHALRSEAVARIEAMLALARHFEGVAIGDGALDCSPWLFNTQTGTVEIDPATGDYRCREHRPEDLITKLSPVGFNESADCPSFQRFIGEIFQQDADMIAFAQRALGSCLVGEPEEILHVWYGGGENGKSTLVDILRYILADYATSLPQAFLGKRHNEQIATDTMDLRGARLAVSHEPDQRMVLDESKMKILTGRDIVKARRLYHDPVEFTPTHKLVLVTNHRPQVQTQTRATWRRICLWPFLWTVPPDKKDRTLGEKLRSEAPGILNWLLAGCSEWVAAGRHCDPPACVQEATREYRLAEDVIGEWLAECTLDAPEATAFRDLFANYETWARGRGFEKLFSTKRLSMLLEEHGYRRRTLGGQRLFEGIRLR